MELQELLAFVDECYANDAANYQQQQRKQTLSPSVTSTRLQSERNAIGSDTAAPKTRPRREAVEYAALQAQMAVLTLELKAVKQKRSIRGGGSALPLTGASHWLTETDRQSRLRRAAQEENERLRAKVQDHKKTAKRLVNAIKRNSTNQILQMLFRYEYDAKLRNEKIDDSFNDFDHIYRQTDAMFADAEMRSLPSTCFDARIRQQSSGFFVDIRSRMCMIQDFHSASEAYWHFNPQCNFSERFYVEQKESLLGETRGHNFVLKSKIYPSCPPFHGQYLLHRFKTEKRVVVVCKILMEAEGVSKSPLLRLHGQGWTSFHASTTDSESSSSGPLPPTRVEAVARYFPESKPGTLLNPDHVLKDEDLRTLIDFLVFGSKAYSALPSQSATTMR